jgi:hypothetical protein
MNNNYCAKWVKKQFSIMKRVNGLKPLKKGEDKSIIDTELVKKNLHKKRVKHIKFELTKEDRLDILERSMQDLREEVEWKTKETGIDYFMKVILTITMICFVIFTVTRIISLFI